MALKVVKISKEVYALLEEMALAENKTPAGLVEEVIREKERKNHILELL